MAARRKVTGIFDGDTIKVARKIEGIDVIRLANVNAPEKGRPRGDRAKNELRGMVGGKTVTIKPVAVDPYGRLVAEVIADRKSVNKRMRERGY